MNRTSTSVWYSDPDNISEENKEAFYSLLDPDEQQRYEKIKSISYQQQYMLTHVLLRLNFFYRFDILPSSWQQYLFLKAWVLKEAYLKAIGTGLHRSLKDVKFDITSDKPKLIDEPNTNESQWNFSFFQIEESHIGAVTIEKYETQKIELAMKKISIDSLRSMINELE